MALSIYDINFNNKAIELLPPDKRQPKHIGWLQALLSPFQILRDKYFGQYRTGTTCVNWAPGIWGLNALVKYKGIVYQSLINAATLPIYDSTGATVYSPGQFVINSATNYVYVCLRTTSGAFINSNWAYDAPISPNWKIYLPSFLGTNERILFNGNKTILEYALNQYFQTNFNQPGLLGYYYPANTPGTPTSGDANHLLHSDIFILNNDSVLQGFNVGTRDFIPDIFRAGGPRQGGGYIAGLSKVMVGNFEYLCRVSNTDSTFNSLHWFPGIALPANYILTAGVVNKDISDTVDYIDWVNGNYTAGQGVIFDGFVYICILDTTSNQSPGDTAYWFKIDGLGYSKIFLSNTFTIYFPSATYALTNDSEINNFVRQKAYAGVSWQNSEY